MLNTLIQIGLAFISTLKYSLSQNQAPGSLLANFTVFAGCGLVDIVSLRFLLVYNIMLKLREKEQRITRYLVCKLQESA